MTQGLERAGFAVRVEGGFVDEGQWLIHGVVEYQPSLAVSSWKDIEAEARAELMLTIARESRSARARGARSVYVVVDGDDEVAGFFRMMDRLDSRRAPRPVQRTSKTRGGKARAGAGSM